MEKFKDFIKNFLQIVITAVVIVFICFKFLFISTEVKGSSMYPTLQDGDRGFSFVITRNISINRFDICVIDSDKAGKLIVKRIIGMPNEKVTYKDNKLYINDEYIEETFLGDDVYTEDFEAVLGKDEYFCLGDNRSVSRDSRYYGAFSKSEIKSTDFLAYFPFNRIGIK